MKNILKSLLALAAVAAVSCETYDVEAPDMTAVAPLDGRYICWAYDYDEYAAASDKSAVEPVNFYETRISATEGNDSDKIWIYVTEYLNNYPLADCTCAKIGCNVSARTFSAAGVANTESPAIMFNPLLGQGYYTIDYRAGFASYKVTIGDGKLELKGYDTPTGHKADAISFSFERAAQDGNGESIKLMIVGHRSTGWGEDYEDFNDFIDGE